ncbi:hypothetical protein AX774_g5864 [Zancudomyces culisetae]|uniref:Uncharacterized protein n=1 Tax=Zancudomyces culisetae TaxID=1213189 RepID=A0A1R1PI84_ZANCU|nr:hypothetical protein AX774_g5864 [Zancudomyces culisetae]|eukprot:OMH80694.1 hypothetical protein AX774_g5864 [Zancudomyces culisetae]
MDVILRDPIPSVYHNGFGNRKEKRCKSAVGSKFKSSCFRENRNLEAQYDDNLKELKADNNRLVLGSDLSFPPVRSGGGEAEPKITDNSMEVELEQNKKKKSENEGNGEKRGSNGGEKEEEKSDKGLGKLQPDILDLLSSARKSRKVTYLKLDPFPKYQPQNGREGGIDRRANTGNSLMKTVKKLMNTPQPSKKPGGHHFYSKLDDVDGDNNNSANTGNGIESLLLNYGKGERHSLASPCGKRGLYSKRLLKYPPSDSPKNCVANNSKSSSSGGGGSGSGDHGRGKSGEIVVPKSGEGFGEYNTSPINRHSRILVEDTFAGQMGLGTGATTKPGAGNVDIRGSLFLSCNENSNYEKRLNNTVSRDKSKRRNNWDIENDWPL